MAKILVIEDSEDIREMITIVLKAYDYEVSGISIDENINSVISNFNPQLVLLDVWFGLKSGSELCMQIKSFNKGLPIILMTADSFIKNEFQKFLADDFIEKPFDIMDLKNKIDKLLK